MVIRRRAKLHVPGQAPRTRAGPASGWDSVVAGPGSHWAPVCGLPRFRFPAEVDLSEIRQIANHSHFELSQITAKHADKVFLSLP